MKHFNSCSKHTEWHSFFRRFRHRITKITIEATNEVWVNFEIEGQVLASWQWADYNVAWEFFTSRSRIAKNRQIPVRLVANGLIHKSAN